MREKRGNEEVTVTLTRFEWHNLLRGGRHLRNKAERQIDKNPDFVPEPGKIDINKEFINQYNSALDKIEAVWGVPLDHYRD